MGVLRASLELGQVRQEIDRKIAEKVEEFDNTRKNHQRAMDSLQASLEGENKAKTEALRVKKKLETDINELEIALDHANKANAEAHKSVMRFYLRLSPVKLLNLLRNQVWLTGVELPCWLSLKRLTLFLILLAVARSNLMLNWLLPVALSMT